MREDGDRTGCFGFLQGRRSEQNSNLRQRIPQQGLQVGFKSGFRGGSKSGFKMTRGIAQLRRVLSGNVP
jgi:hypothetical protein